MSISLKKLKKKTLLSPNKKSPVKKPGRFDGLSEEEVKKNTLKDILDHNLDLVFVGINPSLMAAHTGRYYAGPGNHFYKLLYASELIPEPITFEADNRLLEYKIGLTNIVARATRSSADLSKAEIRKGAMFIEEKLKHFKPKIAIFNGKCIYEEFVEKFDKKTFCFGLQPLRVQDTALWVVPSSSARCSNFPRMQDKLHFYTSLKKYLSFIKGEIKEVNLNEFYFEGKCKQAIPSTSKMWRRKGVSAFANGGRIANKETIGMDTSEHELAIPQSTEFIISNLNRKENIDIEKDSGVYTDTNENSKESCEKNDVKISKNNSRENYNLRKTQRQPNKRINKQKVENAIRINVLNKARSQSTDFLTLIKQRVNNKQNKTNESKEKTCDQDENLLQSNNNAKKVKILKLR